MLGHMTPPPAYRSHAEFVLVLGRAGYSDATRLSLYDLERRRLVSFADAAKYEPRAQTVDAKPMY